MIANTISVIPDGGVASAPGFKCAGIVAGLKQNGTPDMALVVSDMPANFAGAFTTCSFAAAPVQLSRMRVQEGGEKSRVSAVIVNSGNANACTGSEGMDNAVRMVQKTADALGIASEEVLVASTGRIGVQLPMDIIEGGIDSAAAALGKNNGSLAARAIMTTDTYAKEFAVEFELDGETVVVGGMAKGAGMIAPAVSVPHATMIACLTTNAKISNSALSALLDSSVAESFNCVTVDGDMSTNDTVFLLANGHGPVIEAFTAGAELFAKAIGAVTQHLAKEMAKDAEGATKFVTVAVEGAASTKDASLCAGAIANSLLCKTAWFGEDPNWGRVLAAVGSSGAVFDPDNVSLDYDEAPVVRGGMDAGTSEERLCEVMRRANFTVKINLNCGNCGYTMWTNDISYEYVKINADYHT